MDQKVARADISVAKIAARQHGVVSFSQIRQAGLSEKTVRRRVAAGRLHRVHRGVYAVGHSALSPGGKWMAAVLGVGNGSHRAGDLVLDYWGAAVSHRGAACVWGLLQVTEHPVDVIVRGDGGRAKRHGIHIHRSHTLAPADVIVRHGIPVTRPARTIADLRRAVSGGRQGAVSTWELRKAIRQANVLGLPIEEKDRDRTRSDLEEDFLSLCRRHRIVAPEVNVPLGPYLVDFLWRDNRFVVETDSYIYHGGKEAFQDDRNRDLELKRLGFEVLRLSERQVDEEADRVAETLKSCLDAGPQPATKTS